MAGPVTFATCQSARRAVIRNADTANSPASAAVRWDTPVSCATAAPLCPDAATAAAPRASNANATKAGEDFSATKVFVSSYYLHFENQCLPVTA